MRKSKVTEERYTITQPDLVKILSLGATQKITNITVASDGRTTTGAWSLLVNVENTESTELAVPSFTEK